MLSFKEFITIKEDIDILKHGEAFKAASNDDEFNQAHSNLMKDKPSNSHLRDIYKHVSGFSDKRGKRDQLIRNLQTAHNQKLREKRRGEIAKTTTPFVGV